MDNIDVLHAIKTKVECLKSWLKAPVAEEHIYVVGRDGLWISSIEVVDGKLTGKHQISGNAIDARTFSRANADIIAKVTQNGNGFFYVQTKEDAVKDCLQGAESALTMFKFLESDLV